MAEGAGAGGEPRYAAFVSPHGFGHAARASAVLAALHRTTGAGFEIFTTVPRWFFDEAIAGTYRYHELACDVGFRQRSALEHDLEATVAALDALLPFDDDLVDRLASTVRDAGCRAVLCDIAPLGIAVAERAGLPSVLVESFSWPWLYRPLLAEAPGLGPAIEELARWTSRATLHVQTEPLCRSDPEADLRLPPGARVPRRPRDEVRQSLGVPPEAPLVLLTMGGVPQRLPFVERLGTLPDIHFVVSGAAATERRGNALLFDATEALYTPDLLRASDAVVAKLGYSTIAEVWHEGLPFGWVSRQDSPEMGPLRAFVARETSGFEIPAGDFEPGSWIERVPELLTLPRRAHDGRAAERAAELLRDVG